MPGTGTGTGTPITLPGVTASAVTLATGSAIPLWRYAQRIGYRECAFFGINHPDNANYACRRIWTGAQRRIIGDALAEAQDELETELHFFMAPRWTEDERHPCKTPLQTVWGHVIEAGVLLNTLVGDSLSVNYAADPALVTMLLGSYDPDTLHLYHEDTGTEVYASEYVLSGGNITWRIPWCRLVAPDYEDNDEAGYQYADVATWGAVHLDVRALTTDTSEQATLIHQTACADGACADTRYTGCVYVRDNIIGTIEVRRATYASGAWTRACSCYSAQWVLVSYKSGMETLTNQAQDTLIRLAHSKMPEEPCGCDVTQRLWARDRNIPQVATRERINCPFGLSDGAWTAWRFAQTMKLVRGGMVL